MEPVLPQARVCSRAVMSPSAAAGRYGHRHRWPGSAANRRARQTSRQPSAAGCVSSTRCVCPSPGSRASPAAANGASLWRCVAVDGAGPRRWCPLGSRATLHATTGSCASSSPARRAGRLRASSASPRRSSATRSVTIRSLRLLRPGKLGPMAIATTYRLELSTVLRLAGQPAKRTGFGEW
jgi:hypothetical protein